MKQHLWLLLAIQQARNDGLNGWAGALEELLRREMKGGAK